MTVSNPTFHDTADDPFSQDRWVLNAFLIRNAVLDTAHASSWSKPANYPPPYTDSLTVGSANELVYAFTDKEYIRDFTYDAPFSALWSPGQQVPSLASSPRIFGASAAGQGSGSVSYTGYTHDVPRYFPAQFPNAVEGYGPTMQDDFYRANETPMAGNWTLRPGYSALDLVGPYPANPNDVRLAATTGPCEMYWNAATFGPSCAASIKLISWYTGGGQGAQYNLELCLSGASLANSYAVELTVLASGAPATLNLRRRGSWVHACPLTGLPATIASGDELGLAVNGRLIEIWYQHGGTWSTQPLVSVDDAALSGTSALPAGYAAIGGNEPGGLSLAQAVHIDEFRAGNIAGDPQPLESIMVGLKPQGGTPTQIGLVTSYVTNNPYATAVLPSGILSGDTLLVQLALRQANAIRSIVAPTGWALLAASPTRDIDAFAGGLDQLVYYRLAPAMSHVYGQVI